MTNGILTINRNGEPIIKVLGCDGNRVVDFAKAIELHHYNGGSLRSLEIARIARENEFSCPDCLIIIWGSSTFGYCVWHRGEKVTSETEGWSDRLLSRHISILSDPGFDFRSEYGAGVKLATVDLWEPCLVCGRPVEGYSPVYCCSGYMCGCQGLPVDLPICSDDCRKALNSGALKISRKR